MYYKELVFYAFDISHLAWDEVDIVHVDWVH